MNITESELSAEFQRAKSKWPFINQTELASGLPRMLLFAVGSRETNLTNEVGDFDKQGHGHGHGVWQLDDRSHTPPGGFAQFDGNVPLQCSIAADMLHGLLAGEAGNVGSGPLLQLRASGDGVHDRQGLRTRRRRADADPAEALPQRRASGEAGPPGLPGIWASRRPSCGATT